MTKREKYNQTLNNIGAIFHELYYIVEVIKNDFEEENRQDPGLTMTIVNYHLDIIKKYNSAFQSRILNQDVIANQGWSLEKQIKSSSQKISSFHREFDNPFLGSERWYQRIVQLQGQLTEQARELDKLIADE